MMDLDRWAQREGLKLAVFRAKEVGKKTCDAVEISVSGDVRDFSNDRYVLKAYQEKPTNLFLCERPLIEAPHLDTVTCERVQDCKQTQQGHSARVTSHKKDVKENPRFGVESFILQFPENMKLTDRQFLQAGEETDELEIDSMLVAGKVGIGVRNHENFAGIQTWRLCDMNTEVEVKGDSAKKKKGKKQMDALFDDGTTQQQQQQQQQSGTQKNDDEF